MFQRSILQAVVATFISFSLQQAAIAQQQQLDNSRYPYRVPDWLWTDANRTHLFSKTTRESLEKDIRIHAALADVDTEAADEIEAKIARKIGESLCIHDLTWDTTPLLNKELGLKLSVQIDPSFDDGIKKLLMLSAERYLKVALDEELIEAAIRESITNPEPMPPKYETTNGQQVLTKAYKDYLKSRSKPRDVSSFRSHLRSALSGSSGEPALLVISRYTGNVWWGGAYYDFYHDPIQSLRREDPSQHFMYIRINSDRFKTGMEGASDPDFWASKIGHEILHNLGYWHPGYNDPEERDASNPPAFLVAYERGILERLRRPTPAPAK